MRQWTGECQACGRSKIHRHNILRDLRSLSIKLKEQRERDVVRVMCVQKVLEKRWDMLKLKETIDRLATANGVKWYEHLLRRVDNSILRVLWILK